MNFQKNMVCLILLDSVWILTIYLLLYLILTEKTEKRCVLVTNRDDSSFDKWVGNYVLGDHICISKQKNNSALIVEWIVVVICGFWFSLLKKAKSYLLFYGSLYFIYVTSLNSGGPR
jgi:hypothetical protein